MSVHDHKHQKKSSLSIEDVNHLTLIPYDEIEDINSDKYNWEQVGTSKYGRAMYCSNTKTLRSQTMGEFYGTGIVD